MQILMHADPNSDGGHLMAEHLTTVVNNAMARFGERITRVEAHLSDVDSPAKSGSGAIHCTLEARLAGLDAIVVKAQAGNAHQAIEGAVRKLRRAAQTALVKHDLSRRHRAPPDAPADDAAIDSLK